MRERKQAEEDLDDFMASVLSGNTTETTQLPSRDMQRTTPALSISVKSEGKSPYKIKRSIKWTLILLPILAVTLVGGYLLWQGPAKKMLEPASPFTEQQKSALGVPLYYPSRLSGDFKIETGSITQPEKDVIIYVVSDDKGGRFNISLQRQPTNLNLEPLHASLTGLHDIQTKLGTFKVGSAPDGTLMANITTGQTWVIISGNKSILTDELLIEVIDGLKS